MLISQLSDIGVDFDLQGGGRHTPRALADDVVDQGAGLGRFIGIHYAQQSGRAFPTDGATSAYSTTRSRSLRKVYALRVPHEADPQVMGICSRATSGRSQNAKYTGTLLPNLGGPRSPRMQHCAKKLGLVESESNRRCLVLLEYRGQEGIGDRFCEEHRVHPVRRWRP